MPRREKQPRIAFLAFTKNCAMSRILPYLWVNKLAYHSLMDVDGRYEIPGSKTKNFVTHGESNSWRISMMFICWFPRSRKFQGRGAEGPSWMPSHAMDSVIGEKHWAEGSYHFHSKWKRDLICLEVEVRRPSRFLFISLLKVSCCKQNPTEMAQVEWSGPCLLAFLARICTDF